MFNIKEINNIIMVFLKFIEFDIWEVKHGV